VGTLTKVKICGITNRRDAVAAIEYGADMLGIIGVPESPRYVTPAQFLEISAALPPSFPIVIVVNRPEDGLQYPAKFTQHYNESIDDNPQTATADRPRIRAFRIKDESSLEQVRTYIGTAYAVLLDAYSPTVLGGSGHTFPWELAVKAKDLTSLPILLAGGLTADNVAAAVAGVRPFAVDVASGVEASPGVKDLAKVKAFIDAVRAQDLRS
jgi:phosphoribosylanthranilate isomerase